MTHDARSRLASRNFLTLNQQMVSLYMFEQSATEKNKSLGLALEIIPSK